MRNLQTLNLDSNSIYSEKTALNLPPSLNQLDLDNNNLARFEYIGPSSLSTFYASRNQITRIKFTNCTNLNNLYLSGNKLTKLADIELVNSGMSLNTLSLGQNIIYKKL